MSLSTNELIANVIACRTQLMQKMLGTRRDIDHECDYPVEVTVEMYRNLYDREGVAHRVVSLMPEESWTMNPEIYEQEESQETEFEKAWEDLQKRFNILHYMERVDIMSGIGHYGVLLLGIDDGRALDQPVEGVNDEEKGTGKKERRLLFLRVFDESLVTIAQWESSTSSPRYGKPIMYNVQFNDPKTGVVTGIGMDTTVKAVHWTRLIHIADNRESSEVFSVPRQRPVINRILDIRKVASGSAEMYWNGAFPGYSFEVSPEVLPELSDVDAEALQKEMRKEIEKYSAGLQRYVALLGITAKSLAPQVSDPTKHIEIQLKLIALTLGVPWRVFVGSEEAKLASSEDTKAWNKRLGKRQQNYLTPMLVRPIVDRLIAYGCLPAVEEYHTDWPDLAAPSDKDKADVALTNTQSMSTYVGGNVDNLVAPMEYLTKILGLPEDEAKVILDAAEKHIEESIADGTRPDPNAPPAVGPDGKPMPAPKMGSDGKPIPSAKTVSTNTTEPPRFKQ